jgi:hypothetical protein
VGERERVKRDKDREKDEQEAIVKHKKDTERKK